MKSLILAIIVTSMTILSISGLSFAAATSTKYDPTAKEICSQAAKNSKETPPYCAKSSTSGNPITGSNGVVPQLISFIALLAGSVAVIMVIIGGIKFALSNGDPAKAADARQTIFYALIGLVVVVAAQAIISFAVNKLT